MKKLFFFLLATYCCFSQNNNYIVNYEFIRTKGQFVFDASGVLEVDSKNNVSKFKLSQYSNLLKDGRSIYDPKDKDTIKVIGSNRVCYDDKIYYYNYAKDSVYTVLYNKYCKSKVLIREDNIYPDWKIESSSKKISGYNTQKATAFINDRTWTVYFTDELNINGGPWRLIGLPGLVLEAFENTSIYKFNLISLKKMDEHYVVTKPYHHKQSTFREFMKKAIKRQENEIFFRLSDGDFPDELDKNDFPLYEVLDFIEDRN